MWPERVDGNLAMVEGTMTFKKDAPVENLNLLSMEFRNFTKEGSNLPLLAIRRNNESRPICGPQHSLWAGGIPPALGAGGGAEYVLDPAGYFSVMPTREGIGSTLFNLGSDPVLAWPWGQVSFILPAAGRTFSAGQSLTWRYLVIMEGLDQPVHNLHRVERLREYYGLNGKHGSGLRVRRGKLLSHFGLVDLAPEGGIVEFEVPAPDFPLQLPLGLRFLGFNPNWAIGQLQISGYSMGNYTNGRNVFRSLAVDDRDMAYLAVYPDNVPMSHSIVGHPVQCDHPELIIEFCQLGSRPMEYRLAVNNPTDAPINATLKKCMDLPGFAFADKKITVAPGAYVVIREK
jgi:hypothetical protein